MDIKGKCKAKDFKQQQVSHDLQNYLFFKTIGLDYVGGR